MVNMDDGRVRPTTDQDVQHGGHATAYKMRIPPGFNPRAYFRVAKQYRQETSPKSSKTQIKVLAYPGLA